ncbi:AAA family ATPase [Salinisphaera sp. Q1T1-3]|uniref:AAA family ATPase n=1 Tax=Salinisphaera sp. Q1T1-3 TaxID=2321229 RepID=UPI000E75DD3E|nr:AAA family ATPase [Salinisphaera sp. Q1T1-3]RJS92313.1 anticodon nuclease [Salinisphaera sp. Q1T1-3]
MSQSLRDIAKQLRASDKKVQLIYAFNGSGKTRLSREFKTLVAPKLGSELEDDEEVEAVSSPLKILYYNAFTEDLFYWDNDLAEDLAPKLMIQPNAFTKWALVEQGQDQNAIEHFQHYSSDKLNAVFNPDFSEVSFSFERGNEARQPNVKLSKGEESTFIWSVFHTMLDLVVETLNVAEEGERDTDQFNALQYVFIDDPVSSLDDNHLIELAVDIAGIIKRSESALKFIITTHNPLFYNVLHNEFGNASKYLLQKAEDGSHTLKNQTSDSPFSYHLYLKRELETAIATGQVRKYHFNFLRNLLEKTSTFLGYEKWADLLPTTSDGRTNPYESRMINLFSHSKHSAAEVTELRDDDKRMLAFLVSKINETYRFKSAPGTPAANAEHGA